MVEFQYGSARSSDAIEADYPTAIFANLKVISLVVAQMANLLYLICHGISLIRFVSWLILPNFLRRPWKAFINKSFRRPAGLVAHPLMLLVRLAGFEPATCGLEVRKSSRA